MAPGRLRDSRLESSAEHEPLLRHYDDNDDNNHDPPSGSLTCVDDDAIQVFVSRTNLGPHLALFCAALQSPPRPTQHHPQHGNTTDNPVSKWSQPWTLYLAITATALGAIGQGWAQTSMNGANLTFPHALGIDSGSSCDNLIVGLVNSAIYLSNGVLGAWLAAPLNALLGRRTAVFYAAAVSLPANLGAAAAPTWQILLGARLILGCALGVISTTLNIYTAECAPAAIRGGLAVSWQFSCAFGIFLGFVANVALYNAGSSSWRLQLAASGAPMIPLLPLILLVPESPAWLIKHDITRGDRAFDALLRLRNTELEAARELYFLYQSQQQQQHRGHIPASGASATSLSTGNTTTSSSSSSSSSAFTKLTELITIPRIRHATFAAHTVMIGQQLCGINIISFYSTSIFTSANFTPIAALLASCVFGLLNFVFAIPAIWTMDSLGRRSLLLWTLPVMGLCMLLAGVSFSLPSGQEPGSSRVVLSQNDDDLVTINAISTRFALLASMIYLFCIFYSPGMGPVPAAYSAEVFPLSHREVGTSSAVSATNVWAAALSASFPWLVGVAGEGRVFGLYAGLNGVSWVLVWCFVRETRMMTLEELDEVFEVGVGDFVRGEVEGTVHWLKGLLGKAHG